MSVLATIWKMSLVEYVDYLESQSLYTGIDPHEVNREYRFEISIIDDERYERAKWELHERTRFLQEQK